MSLAVLTDSTTAHASPALILRPTSGNSTKTTSVSSCWAWSVIPIVATSPATRTHSCDFAYFKSEGTLAMRLLRQGGGQGSRRNEIPDRKFQAPEKLQFQTSHRVENGRSEERRV